MLINNNICTTVCPKDTYTITKNYPFNADKTLRSFKNANVPYFMCSVVNTPIAYCKRYSFILENARSDITDFNSFAERCMECSFDAANSVLTLPQLDPTKVGSYNYADTYAYLPTKETLHFTSQKLSFEDDRNQIISYSVCRDFNAQSGALYGEDTVSQYTFAQSYTPQQPNYQP